MEQIGWAIITNLHILFAVAIGGSWAKERAGGAFAAVIAFVLINVITGSIFGVTADMLNDANAVTHTLFGQEIAVNGYFTSVLGAPALNMGVFVGIISGFVGGIAYNKYYNFRDGTDLAFSNLVIMLEAVTNCNGELLALLKELRIVEEKQRNYVAHTIIAISENDLMNIEPKLNSAQILEKLRKAFSLVMDGEEYFKKNIYDELNFHIQKTLEDFKL